MKGRFLSLAFAGLVAPAVALTAGLTPVGAQASARSGYAVTGQMVVDKAIQYVGYPYARTGSHPKTGFSCIGLVWYVFQSLGVDMPGDLSSAMAAYPRVSESDLLPGDIIFFKNTVWRGVSHVGIYIGGGKMVSAEDYRFGVAVSALRNDPNNGSYFQRHYLVAERPVGYSGVQQDTPSGRQVAVAVPSLNLRADHSLDAIVETVLPHGTTLDELGSWGEWYHVELQSGYAGWVIQAGVTTSLTPTVRRRRRPPANSYPVQAGVNVHDGPDVADPVMTVTYAGWRVFVLGTWGRFSHVKLMDGRTGWVLTQFVSMPRSPSPRRRVRREPTSLVLAGVNIHAGPSVSDQVVVVTGTGWRVHVLRSSGGFSEVKLLDGRTGWVLSRFLRRSHSAPSAPSRPVVVGHGVLTITAHIRSGPSLSAHIIRWVSAGTHLVLLGHVPLWDHVRISRHLSGYIYAQFIRG